MDVGSIKNSLNPALATGRSASAATPVDTARKQVVGAEPAGEERAAQTAPGETASISREQVESAVSTIQEFVQSVRRNINFSLEDTSGRVVVKVTDSTSGDIIRQIPSEEALQLAESLQEVRSLLFKAEA
ncbi:flagellar protein FlaG [Aquipseudomonas guryensis]|jgi:flagellar protein FlaG|uniref:Flagellar protein FlaG n=1 Tax=Aquipseudomonas guryensis TaxID=2759165 RepID=A0A7W4DBQ9_9GAMM|nr:flagellar protein FlaG [Pseudomonas guryensis]MBB1519630.1 flagellar protein FlaG [Pseudomonas guryensis]